ncbi:MAG: flagellar biosynthesis protein FlgB [Robiginitomaculum sp.]|nr:MAG: flagellar biosynthesis protein FlgB [Robiginitomaculum sp.]
MTSDLSLLKMASAMAEHASRRHAVIAKNIANADTPGFKAQDVVPFADIYKTAARTGVDIADVAANSKTLDMSSPSDPNGNSVSLEEQMLNSSSTVGKHDLAMLLYRKTMDMMKMAIGKNI